MNFSFVRSIFEVVLNFNFNTTKTVTHLSGGRVLRWNSPVILAFSLVVFIVHLSYQTSYGEIIGRTFSVGGPHSWADSSSIPNLFLYVFFDGGRWGNISASMMLIVLLGPIIEERIGSIQRDFVSTICTAGYRCQGRELFSSHP